jgi:hypothetical protein
MGASMTSPDLQLSHTVDRYMGVLLGILLASMLFIVAEYIDYGMG